MTIEEGMPVSRSTVEIYPATETVWRPYKLWRGDLMECKSCGHEIVTGYGLEPLRHHYELDYGEVKKQENPIAFIEDC